MSSANPYLEGKIYQEPIRTAIRLIDETKTRLAETECIRENTAQTIEKSKTSIRKCEDLQKHAQKVLTMRKF